MARIISSIGERLPHGWGDVFKQIGLFAFADVCYETVRGIAEGKEAVAFDNARLLIDAEVATGTFFEPDVQQALISQRWLIDVANFLYMNSHFVLTTGFLVWMYLRRNESFYFLRNMFMIAMGLALIGYTLMPTAPPRLIPEEGFVDTITAYAQVNHDSALVQIFVNPYAAVPSMHCAFALMIGVTGAMVSTHRATRIFWALYPALVFFVVIVTANHFWVDGAIGWAVAGLAAFGAHQLARSRPGVWSFRPAEARA